MEVGTIVICLNLILNFQVNKMDARLSCLFVAVIKYPGRSHAKEKEVDMTVDREGVVAVAGNQLSTFHACTGSRN